MRAAGMSLPLDRSRALRGSAEPRYLRAMERLVAVVEELSLARSLERVQDIVRKAARELTGADGATFVLRDNGHCYYADEDAIEPLWKGKRFPMGLCISGWVMLNRRPVIIPDIYLDSRIPHDAYRPTFVHSLAVVPIRTLAPIGAIGVYWSASYTATADELQLLAALAKHGVEPIAALGRPFDPNQHEALLQQPDAEHPEGTVVAELSRGYKIRDRVLRPSKVAVSVKPS